MKYILKLGLIMVMLLSTIIIVGCGKNESENKYLGTWVGYDGNNVMYRITFQENGKEYMVTEDKLFYKSEKNYPKPHGSLFPSFDDSVKQANNTYNINFILQKDSRTTTAREITPQNEKDDKEKDKYKNQLSYDEGRTIIRYIEKDNTLLINGIRYKKETSPDITNDILKQMKNARRMELETKFHKYGNRAIGSNHNLVIIDKITFDDSILTSSK